MFQNAPVLWKWVQRALAEVVCQKTVPCVIISHKLIAAGTLPSFKRLLMALFFGRCVCISLVDVLL